MQATMSRAYSSGAPLPLVGEVHPLKLWPLAVPIPLSPPPPCFVLRWGGGLRRSWGLTLLSYIRPRMNVVHS